MVDNSNIPFKCIVSYSNMSSVLPNTLTMSYMLQKEKIQNHFNEIEHISIEQVLADPLTKGLPPSVLREHAVDMGLW